MCVPPCTHAKLPSIAASRRCRSRTNSAKSLIYGFPTKLGLVGSVDLDIAETVEAWDS